MAIGSPQASDAAARPCSPLYWPTESRLLARATGDLMTPSPRTIGPESLAEEALRARGYTLLLAMSANAINPSIYSDLHFNFMHDAAPVASISLIPLVM